MSNPVPTFYLYGEPHRHVDERFVHVEDVENRSRPSEWTIRPHAHAELNHVFHIRSGGGELQAESARLPFAAPCLIVMPAGVIHGFGWERESRGAVLTASNACLERLMRVDATLAMLFTRADIAPIDDDVDRDFATATGRLMQELGWGAPGHRAAAEAHLLDLLVQALRVRRPREDGSRASPKSQVSLVARYRERVETRFRLREPVAVHAAALGTSETRLRAACAAVARQSPMRILDQRALLEAQRALLYSDLTIAEIALKTGFEDAAYFSRFFRRNVHQSPRLFRGSVAARARPGDSIVNGDGVRSHSGTD